MISICASWENGMCGGLYDWRYSNGKVDRPMGSYHPKHKDIYYPINYGYIEGMIAPDGEEQDAYLLGLVNRFRNIQG